MQKKSVFISEKTQKYCKCPGLNEAKVQKHLNYALIVSKVHSNFED